MKHDGFSLIELIFFILIIGIAASVLLLSFQTILKNSPTGNRQTIALGLAQERMELILTQYREKGFSVFSDPCASGYPPSICTLPTGYSINSSPIANNYNGDTNYKVITVTISGLGNATLKTLVGN